MTFFSRLFRKTTSVSSDPIPEFWEWFSNNAAHFYKIVQQSKQVDKAFLDKIMPKLQAMNEAFYCVTGMLNENIAEFIVTAEGDVKSFVFVEELIAAAPPLERWKFTALKPPLNIAEKDIEMDGYVFNTDTIRFFPLTDPDRPDEIAISFLHPELRDDNYDSIFNGCCLFVETWLGELRMATLIDDITCVPAAPPDTEPIPLSKLEQYLEWREKEFLEKYDNVRAVTDTEEDAYVGLTGKDREGRGSIALFNQVLLAWEAKASYPWMQLITISYHHSPGGMPNQRETAEMDAFQEELEAALAPSGDHLVLGRTTYNGNRNIYAASRNFREVSRITAGLIATSTSGLKISYEIFKDKYWSHLDHFMAAASE